MRNHSHLLSYAIGLVAVGLALGGACTSQHDEASFDAASRDGPARGDGVGDETLGGDGADVGASAGSGSGPSCASVSSEAKAEARPADIVFVIDTSASMSNESAEVQQNLNAFATLIAQSGVDAHVALIADRSLCIPAPLGSGSCFGDDSRPPAYQHVLQRVDSHDALDRITQTYPLWKGMLRDGSVKRFAVVSDDDAFTSAAEFTQRLRALDPGAFAEFTFDAIVASQDPLACTLACLGGTPGPCCPACAPISFAEGRVYEELVRQTAGVFGDLCRQDFDPVFTSMASAVIGGAKLSCEYEIPAAPAGATFNPAQVNVVYTPSNAAARSFGLVSAGAAGCGSEAAGWYYDDPAAPTRILLCPATCDAVQRDPSGKIEVQFGCDSVEAVPR